MPKGGGGKGAGAKAAKAAHQEEVKANNKKKQEDAEADKWAQGAKDDKASKKEKAEKAAAAKAAKAERDRLLEEETKSIKPAKPKVANDKASGKPSGSSKSSQPSVPVFSARNIEDAIEALELVNDTEDKAVMGSKAAKAVDAHPERRFKAAFEAYKEQELPAARKEHPGLRLQQYHDLLFKQFQKHPDNPYNQLTVAYDATKQEKVEALKAKKKQAEERLRTD